MVKRLRQKEKIAIQSVPLDLINGLIKKDLTTIGLTNNPDTLKLHEPIYIDSKLYLLVGLKFNAIQGQYMLRYKN